MTDGLPEGPLLSPGARRWLLAESFCWCVAVGVAALAVLAVLGAPRTNAHWAGPTLLAGIVTIGHGASVIFGNYLTMREELRRARAEHEAAVEQRRQLERDRLYGPPEDDQGGDA